MIIEQIQTSELCGEFAMRGLAVVNALVG